MNLLPRPKPVSRPANDDTVVRGMEMALTVLVFLGIGFLLDSLFGTRPLFTIALVVLAFAGQFTKMYFTYTHRMQQLEAERAEGARAGTPRPEVSRPEVAQ